MEVAAVILTSGYYHGVGAAAGNRDSSTMWVMVRRQRLRAPSNGGVQRIVLFSLLTPFGCFNPAVASRELDLWRRRRRRRRT
jgi:hypothetical protein